MIAEAPTYVSTQNLWILRSGSSFGNQFFCKFRKDNYYRQRVRFRPEKHRCLLEIELDIKFVY